MANYFKSIPNVSYDINGNAPNTFQTATNIMKRPMFKPKVIDEITDYYPYRVKDGYRPDMVSNEVYGIRVEKKLYEIIANMDAAVVVTGHDEFKKIDISSFTEMKTPILIDTRGIIDPTIAKKNKLVFRGLGRG